MFLQQRSIVNVDKKLIIFRFHHPEQARERQDNGTLKDEVCLYFSHIFSI
jgi:hypothetical protein